MSRRARDHQSGNAPKRQKLSLDADTFPKGGPDYRPGSIIQVDLVQFLICSNASYRFGPHINLIVSPNGTGKSTAAIAIFLVFLGDTKVINRSNLKDFIKKGSDHASATVFVQGDNPNIVHSVAVKLRDTGETRPTVQRFIDNGPVSESDVLHFTQKFNIYVNNLCVFLLQDRVSAFSAQTSQEVLLATETAVGTKTLVDLHTSLIKVENAMHKFEDENKYYQERIERYQREVAEHEKILEQLSMIRTQQNRIKELDAMKVLLQVLEVESSVRSINDEIKVVEQEISTIQTIHQDSLSQRQNELERLHQEVHEKEGAATAASGAFQLHIQELKLQQTKVQHLLKDLKLTKTELEKSSAQIASLRRTKKETLNSIAEREKSRVDQSTMDQMEAELSRLREQYERSNAKSKSFAAQERGLQHDQTRARHSLSKQEQVLQEAQAYAEKRLGELSRMPCKPWEQDISAQMEKAVKYVRSHASDFQERIYDPAICSLALTRKDPLLLKMVTSTTRQNFLTSFIATNRQDFDKLTKLMAEFYPLIPVLNCENIRPREYYNVRSDAREHGFDGVLTDLLEGPWPVLEVFYRENLHEIPFSLSTVTSGAQDWFFSQGGKTFVDTYGVHSQSVSRYGRHEVLKKTEHLRPVSAFVSYMARNLSPEFQRLRLENAKTGCNSLQSELKNINSQLEKVRTESSRYSEAVEADLDRFTASNAEYQKAIRIAAAIDSAKQKLKGLELEESVLRDGKKQRSASITAILKRVMHEIAVLTHLTRLRKQQEDLNDVVRTQVSSSLSFLTAQCDITILNLATESRKATAVQRKASLEQRKKEAEDLSHRVKERNRELINELSRAEYRRLKDLCKTRTSRSIQDELESLEAEVSLQDQGHSYERSQALLAEAKTSLQESRRQLSEKANAYNAMRSEYGALDRQYKGQINEIVKKVSEKFKELFLRLTNCQGSVALERGRNFADWGLNVLVSFRSNEKKSPLSQGRHSGGERALTTAIYLMSLQELTKSPFCVIDEINQGMDSENEEAFHNLLMGLASRETCRDQYIMITPKLLLGLEYSDKVHIISSFSSTTVDLPTGLNVPEILANM